MPIRNVWLCLFQHKICTGHNQIEVYKYKNLNMILFEAVYPVHRDQTCGYILSCDQAALRILLSVWPSVCHTFFTMSLSTYHHELFRVNHHWHKWCPWKGSRSEVKRWRSQVKTQFSCFRTLTPVWIHIWQWSDAQSLKKHRRGALLFFKVIRQVFSLRGNKNRRFGPPLGVSGL